MNTITFRKMNHYPLLIEFEVHTVSADRVLSSQIYYPSAKCAGHKSERKKQGSVRTEKKTEKSFQLSAPYSEIGPFNLSIIAHVFTWRYN